jgi:hypothetical protein
MAGAEHMGGAPWHCFGHQMSDKKPNNKKYGVTLDGHCLMIFYATTNQKQVAMMKKGKETCLTRREHGGA